MNRSRIIQAVILIVVLGVCYFLFAGNNDTATDAVTTEVQ